MSRTRWNDDSARRGQRRERRRLTCELLEPRLVLYSTTGGAWPHPELVTASFEPDGTDLGGMSNNLQSTMNAKWASATWQQEVLRGLQTWASVSNLNFDVFSDDGSALGAAGTIGGTGNYMQGASNFGDIRIGGFDMGPIILGGSFLPPPINGDSGAGDYQLNTGSSVTWNMGSITDLFTIAAHEGGHSLGLGHSLDTTSLMFGGSTGVPGTMSADDTSGIQAIYGARSQDAFDAASSNQTLATATEISSYIDSNKQITISGLDITTLNDRDWYRLVVPSGSTSTMTIKMQANKLSLLAPKITLYDSGGVAITTVSNTYNKIAKITQSISPGQVYYIKATGADNTVFGIGAYALLVNMGTGTQTSVASPVTATAATGGGGVSMNQLEGADDHGAGQGPMGSLASIFAAPSVMARDAGVAHTAGRMADLFARALDGAVRQDDAVLPGDHAGTIEPSLLSTTSSASFSNSALAATATTAAAVDQLLDSGLDASLASGLGDAALAAGDAGASDGGGE